MSEKLDKNLGIIEVIAICMGSMIGSGIFILPGVAFIEVKSPIVVLSFLIGGILTIPTALSASEMSTAMPQSGGSYLYIQKSMGPLLGTIAGIGNWLVLNFKTALALVGGIPYLILIFPNIEDFGILGVESIVLISVFLTVLFTIINVVSSESAGKAQNYIVGIMMVSIVFLLIGSTPDVIDSSPENLLKTEEGSFIATVALVFISYAGVIKVTSVAEEIKNPGENIPKGIAISLLLTTLVYVSVTYVTVFGLGQETIIDLAQNTPVSEGGLQEDGSGAIIALVAEETIGSIGSVVVVAAALLALASTANSGILSASRYPYAMAKDDLSPDVLSEISVRFSTPIYSILLTGFVVILMVFLPIGSIARLGGAFQVVVFILVNVSLIGFREFDVSYYDPDYYAPFYPYTQIFGILTGIILIAWMGFVPIVGSILIVIVSIAYYLLYVRSNVQDESEVKQKLRQEKKEDVLTDTKQMYDDLDRHGILIPLRQDYDEKKEDVLIDMAENMQSEDIDVKIHVVRFSEEPSKALDSSSPEVQRKTPDWIRKYSNIIFRQIESQNVNESIVEYATYHNLDFILQDYREPESRLRSVSKDIKWVARNSPCKCLTYKNSNQNRISKVSVVLDDIYCNPSKLITADIISNFNNAHLEVVQLIEKNPAEEKLDLVEEYHSDIRNIVNSKLTTETVETDDKVQSVTNYCSDSDLVLVTLRISNLKSRIFSDLATRLVGDLDRNVLLFYSEYKLSYSNVYQRTMIRYIFRGLD